MKTSEFYEMVECLYLELLEIMKSKGQAYSGPDDKLGNFKRVAQKLKLTPEAVWAVYFNKHLDALDSYLRGEYVDSESIDGRIKDLINYLFLLYAIIKEREKNVSKT